MHCLDPRPAMAERRGVTQTHSTPFWDTKEGKHAGYLLHRKKKKSKHHLENPSPPIPKSQLHACYRRKAVFKQDQIKPAKPLKDRTGEFCPVWWDRQHETQNIQQFVTVGKSRSQTGRSRDFTAALAAAAQARESDGPSSGTTSGRRAHLPSDTTSRPQGSRLNPLPKGSHRGKLFAVKQTGRGRGGENQVNTGWPEGSSPKG